MTDTITTLKTATRTGYEHVWSGAINYLRGVWLQLSRGLLAFAWGILALMAAGAAESALVGIAVFLLLPIPAGAIVNWRGKSE